MLLATRPSWGRIPRARTGWLTRNGIRDDGRSSGSRRSRAPGNLAHAKDDEQKGRKNIPLDLYKQKKNKKNSKPARCLRNAFSSTYCPIPLCVCVRVRVRARVFVWFFSALPDSTNGLWGYNDFFRGWPMYKLFFFILDIYVFYCYVMTYVWFMISFFFHVLSVHTYTHMYRSPRTLDRFRSKHS